MKTCRTVILPVVTRTEREEVTADWRKLLNEELHDLHASQNNIRS
jgi:hypothetical protein